MSDDALHHQTTRSGRLVAALRGAWRARATGPRLWLLEILLMITVITALALVLQPRIMLMSASPHPFWLVVIAAALVHGTAAGVTAALAAGLVTWLHASGLGTTEDDFYDLMARTFKEPLLWVFAALVLGALHDRIEAERLNQAEERDRMEADMARLLDHAALLRGRIAELERAVVLGEVRPKAMRTTPVALVPVALVPAPETPVAEGDWASLWMATARGWEQAGSEGTALAPDPGRFLPQLDREPRIYDSRYDQDRLLLPEGAVLAVPLRDHRPRPAGVILLGGPRPGLAVPIEDLVAAAHAAAGRLGWVQQDAAAKASARERRLGRPEKQR